MNMLFVAVKIYHSKIEDVLAFASESDCIAFCMQYADYEPVPTGVFDLHGAIKLVA